MVDDDRFVDAVERLYPSSEGALPGVSVREVAEELGLSRSWVSRVLSQLAREGRLDRREGIRGYRYEPRD